MMIYLKLHGEVSKRCNERKNMRNSRITLINYILILSAAALFSGSCFAGVWTTYTDASFVSGLAVDNNDLWAGTRGGVILWDISSETYLKYTTTEGLADQNVKEVFIDNAGNIWFGTTEGVQCYDGSTWTVYNVSNSPIPDNTVYSIIQDQSASMWFGTGYGCAKFTDPTWEVFTDLGGGATNVAVRGMGIDSQNHIWTANNPTDYGDPGGVSMYNGTSWTNYDPDPGSIGQYFLSLTVDGNDNVWTGSWTNYVFTYNGSTWTHYNDGNSSLLGNNIEAFEIEADSIVWISNHPASPTPSNAGVARYDGSWSILTPAGSGLPDPYVYAISNADGITWFGTANYGTAGYDGSNWDYLETVNEPHTNYFTSIEYGDVGTSDVSLYFGTDHSGIALYDGSTWSCYTSENCGLTDNNINDVHITDNVLWAGSQFMGVWKYDGSTWSNYNDTNSDLLGNIILSVSSDSYGNLWFGTSGWSGPSGQDGALSRFDGSTWTNYYLSNSSLIDDDGLQVFVDNADTVWIGTEEGISKFYYPSNWTSYHSGNSGLIEDHVQAIAFDEFDGKWIATMGGVSHFSGGTWTSYTTADGLPDSYITDICVSDSGIVWVSTADGAASFEDGAGWTSCTQTEGLADNEVNAVSMGDGEVVWFGTDDSGLSSYDPSVTGVASHNSADIGHVLQCFASPNPFYSSVQIQYTVPFEENVNIMIYDMSGRIVTSLINGTQSAQPHSVIWDGSDERGVPVSRGMYMYRVECGSSVATGKLILLN